MGKGWRVCDAWEEGDKLARRYRSRVIFPYDFPHWFSRVLPVLVFNRRAAPVIALFSAGSPRRRDRVFFTRLARVFPKLRTNIPFPDIRPFSLFHSLTFTHCFPFSLSHNNSLSSFHGPAMKYLRKLDIILNIYIYIFFSVLNILSVSL